MKDKKPLDWIPLFIDKHIFGSTRLELEPDERSVWIDLMVLSGKDSGYIRANEGVPYPIKQLAGLLVISEELLERTIDKCKGKKIKKIEIMEDGTMYLPTYEEYKLSARHKRRFESMSGKADIMSGKVDTKSKVKESKVKESRKENLEKEFEDFWKFYYQMGNKEDDPGDKQDAKKAFNVLRASVSNAKIAQATNGYSGFLKHKEIKEGFKQKKMYASTFLRSKKWKRFLDFEYKPPL